MDLFQQLRSRIMLYWRALNSINLIKLQNLKAAVVKLTADILTVKDPIIEYHIERSKLQFKDSIF